MTCGASQPFVLSCLSTVNNPFSRATVRMNWMYNLSSAVKAEVLQPRAARGFPFTAGRPYVAPSGMHAGAALPMFSIFFGEFTNAFGNPNTTPSQFMDVVASLSLKFLYLAIGERHARPHHARSLQATACAGARCFLQLPPYA